MVGSAEATFEEQPLRADQRLRDWVEHRIERDWLDRFLLDVEFQMILEVLADAGSVGDDIDAVFRRCAAGRCRTA
jgi:hypothetical protein